MGFPRGGCDSITWLASRARIPLVQEASARVAMGARAIAGRLDYEAQKARGSWLLSSDGVQGTCIVRGKLSCSPAKIEPDAPTPPLSAHCIRTKNKTEIAYLSE